MKFKFTHRKAKDQSKRIAELEAEVARLHGVIAALYKAAHGLYEIIQRLARRPGRA